MAHIKSDFKPLGQAWVSPWLDHKVSCSGEACWSHWCGTVTQLHEASCLFHTVFGIAISCPIPFLFLCLSMACCPRWLWGSCLWPSLSSTTGAAVAGVGWCTAVLTMALCFPFALPLQHSTHNSPLTPHSLPPPPSRILKKSDILEIGWQEQNH